MIVRKLGRAFAALLFAAVTLPVAVKAQSQEDLNAMYKIKDIGFNHSQVMDIMSYIADVYGPRLTTSPHMRAAAQWTEGEMKQGGLASVHTEPWKFGRGWSNDQFSAMMIAPRPYILIAYPLAWTPGTSGPVTAQAVYAPIESERDFDKYRGKLRGKFVLTQVPPEDPAHYDTRRTATPTENWRPWRKSRYRRDEIWIASRGSAQFARCRKKFAGFWLNKAWRDGWKRRAEMTALYTSNQAARMSRMGRQHHQALCWRANATDGFSGFCKRTFRSRCESMRRTSSTMTI